MFALSAGNPSAANSRVIGRVRVHADILAQFPTARVAVVDGFGLTNGPSEAKGGALLQFADGKMSFDISDNGDDEPIIVPAGEVVWADQEAITCRRWNWRQGRRTRLTEASRDAYFILESLSPPFEEVAFARAVQEIAGGSVSSPALPVSWSIGCNEREAASPSAPAAQRVASKAATPLPKAGPPFKAPVHE